MPHPEEHFWKFNSLCRDVFNSLKKAFTSTPILTHWISDAQLIVETNTSDYALTAILSIVNKDNEVHPVAFYSCIKIGESGLDLFYFSFHFYFSIFYF